MQLTREQDAAAFAKERSVAVVAGAGTGKTRVLTERYLHLLRDRKAEVARILAVTFTEKAAREMKDRIRKALVDAGETKAARDAEFAPVSTIHAFLARILRERALDADLDPRFVIADEITADLLLEEALRETIDGLEPATRGALVDLQGGEQYLVDLYEAVRSTPLEMTDLVPPEMDVDAFAVRMRRFVEDCARQDASAAGTVRRLEGIARLAPRLIELDSDCFAEFDGLVKGGVAAAQRELFVEGRAIRDEYGALRHLDRAQAAGDAIVDALERLDRRYTERKREEGCLDFADLEREGLKLLRGPAGDAVLAEFDHVLVDEYQDTNRLQEAILDRLAEGAARFAVGDEKQSIYRFRYADAAVFQELQERAQAYPLGGSFRSRPELVEFNNALFRAELAGSGVAPQDLRAEAAWRDKEGPCVEVLRPDARDAADGRRKEAMAIARRLRAIVENEELPLTRDDAEGALGYRHCALLLRAMSNLTIYERAFAEAGVPYVVIAGRGYYAAREVVDLAQLLLLLGDPLDDYRATAVMTSLFCGVPEEDLLHLPGYGPWPLRAGDADRPDAIPAERWRILKEFAGRFARWRGLAGRVETGELIETVFAETRFADLMLLEHDGRRRHANLMKALRRARQSSTDYLTFARSLLEFRERELREAEAPIAAETDEAVKIMTVHAAKGLEFPLVVIGDLSRGKGRSDGVVLRADGAFGFKLRDEHEDKIEPPGYAALKEWNNTQEKNEDLRLLYVAFTRAEEHMLLTGARVNSKQGGGKKGVLDRLPVGAVTIEAAALLAPDGRRRRGAAVRGAIRRRATMPPGIERDDAGARELVARVDAVKPLAVNGKPYVAAVADLVEYQRCPRRYRLRRMLGIEYEDYGEGREPSDADEHPRRALGTAFHELMHEVGPAARPDEETIRRHLPDATAKDVEKMRGWSEWLADLQLVRRIGAAKMHPEMPFLTRIGGLPVRGVIDLYVPEVPLLLDYKTGRKVRPEEYTLQVAVYMAAMRGLGFQAPDRAHLVYVDAQQVVEVAEESVEPVIEEFVAAHEGAGRFPPVPGKPCLHCEFRKACARNGVAVPSNLEFF